MNKKGLTLIEIVVSIALISIVMIFLFQIVMTIKNANERQKNISNNKASVLIITREVQKDLDSFGMENTPTTSCNLDTSSNNIVPSSASRVNCIKLLYDGNNVKNNEGYILYYENNNKYFLAYKRGKENVIETQTVREISIEPKDNLDIVIDRVGNVNDYSVRMIMPIRDNTENYDLDINYIYTKAFKKQVQVISENGLAYNLKGSGKYYPNDVVNVSFDYDSVLNQLESVECINNLCPTTNKFSFTMPDEDVIVKINIRADIIPPTCVTNITGGDYINGWTVGVTCSDVGSGCKEGYQTHVGVKQNRTFMVEDKIGNKGYCNVNVPVDNTPPTCSVQNVGGNYSSGFNVKVVCNDNESGCTENNRVYYGLKSNQTYTVYDKAGNSGRCTSSIPVDNTPPTCSVQNVGGNYSSGFNINVVCNDRESGCTENNRVYYGLKSNQTYTVYDKAGNSGKCTSSIPVDNTPPTCSISKSNTGTFDGVHVTVYCHDNESGCREGAKTYYNVRQNQTYTVFDNAGHAGSCTAYIRSERAGCRETITYCADATGICAWQSDYVTECIAYNYYYY